MSKQKSKHKKIQYLNIFSYWGESVFMRSYASRFHAKRDTNTASTVNVDESFDLTELNFDNGPVTIDDIKKVIKTMLNNTLVCDTKYYLVISRVIMQNGEVVNLAPYINNCLKQHNKNKINI